MSKPLLAKGLFSITVTTITPIGYMFILFSYNYGGLVMQCRRSSTRGRPLRLSLPLFTLVASLAWLQTATAFEATIERDALGVPHIFGATDADMAFGLAYAQAEDGWEILEETLPYYRGQAARVFGREAATTDYLVQWLKIWDVIARDYESKLKPETHRYLEAFADGFNHFAALHPERVSLDVLPVTPQDVIAAHMFRHLLFYGFERSITDLRAETRQF